jgi:hypothetical protein
MQNFALHYQSVQEPRTVGGSADDSNSTDLKLAAVVQALYAPSEADEVVFEFIGKFHTYTVQAH